MLGKLSDWQHTLLALAAIIAVTVLAYNGQCNSVDTVAVILAASGIQAAGMVASRAVGGLAASSPTVTPGPGDGGDPSVLPSA